MNRGVSENVSVSEVSQQRRKRLREPPQEERGTDATPVSRPQWPLLKHVLGSISSTSGSSQSQQTPLRINSCLHVFGGFLDVGDDGLFTAEADWLQRHVAEHVADLKPPPAVEPSIQ